VEDDNQPLVPEMFDGLDIMVGDRLRQIDAGDFGAQRRLQVLDRNRHGVPCRLSY
jgi:hypothetical protein